MAYNKTNWQSLPSTDTPISTGNLNKIENGIYDNSLKTDQVGDLTQLQTIEKSTLVGAINENNAKIENITGTILWTNPNPNVGFDAQNITLNSSDYDVLEIYFVCYKSDDRYKSLKIPKGKRGVMESWFRYNSLYYAGGRDLYFLSETVIAFDSAWRIVDGGSFSPGYGSTFNDWFVPQKIIGYKTGLFNV